MKKNRFVHPYDLVSVDTIIEERLTAEPINEYVQSCDIVAFNKICKFIHAKKIIVIIFLVIDDGIGCVVIAEFLLDLVGQKKDAGGWFCGVVIYVVCSCVDHEGSLLLVVLSVC